MEEQQDVDVVIVGAGPVGLTLANLLGVQGVRVLVVERNATLEGEPRAVTLDDESLRTMQAAGLVDDVLRNVVQGYGVQYFAWNGKPLASINPTRQEYGYAKRNAFRQQMLVRTLYDGLARFAHVEVRFGCEFRSFEQDEDRVVCRLKPAGEPDCYVTAPWVVACDGGRSPIRELCGIKLDGDTYPERWLIVDLAERTLALRHTRTYCDPRRPAIRLPGPQATVRYEFMLRPGDRDDVVLDEKTFRDWIAQRVPEDAGLPLVRKVIYGFHARVATRWKEGRVLLAGDAAHLTPPFAGQGLNSGIRDATNLAWKLAAVTRWGIDAALVDTYEPERRPHAAALIRMAMRIGAFMQPKSVFGAVLAQNALRLACLIPACRDYILQLRFKPKPQFEAGYFRPSIAQPIARLWPQPLMQDRDHGLIRLDELLGSGFAVVGYDTPLFRQAARSLLPAGMPGQCLAIVRRDDDFLAAASAQMPSARDTTGELEAALSQSHSVAVVLRPDRYSYRHVGERELRELAAAAPQPGSMPVVEVAALAIQR